MQKHTKQTKTRDEIDNEKTLKKETSFNWQLIHVLSLHITWKG